MLPDKQTYKISRKMRRRIGRVEYKTNTNIHWTS